MAPDRQDYSAMLTSLSPSQAIEVLNNRVHSVGKLNTDIADWLRERKRLEEQYAAGLSKLARRPAVSDLNELGVFSTPWSAIVNSLIELADSHHTLAAKIEMDVERPLRDFNTKNREMQAMTTIQGNCASMARDIEKAQKSSEKVESRGDRASTGRVAHVSRDLDTAQSQWDSQAPYVFETLQALDETRLNHLRDVLTQLQTHEVDLVERNRVGAEQCLNTLLTVETADEIKTFALKTVQNKDQIVSRRRQSSVTAPSPLIDRIPGPSIPDDRASQRSDTLPELPPKPEKARGLKRLGTVLGRKRQSHVPAGADRISESPERSPERNRKLQSSSTFSSFSSRFGRSRDAVPTLEPPQEDSRERPRSPLRTASSVAEEPPVSSRSEAPAMNGSAAAPPANIPNGSHQNDLTGLSLQEPLQPSAPRVAPETTREVPTDNEGFSQRPSDLDPISQAEQDAAAERNQPQYKVDIKDAPVRQDAGDADALASISSTLRMQAPVSAAQRRLGTVRGRRDNRTSVYSQSPSSIAPPQTHTIGGPVSEEGPVQEHTTELRSETPPVSTSSHPFAQPPTTDFRSETPPVSTSSHPFAQPPITASSQSPFSQSSTFQPFQAASGAAAGGGLGAASTSSLPPISPGLFRPGSALGEDAGSIRSGRSLSSVNSGANKHAEMNNPGLNASIVETLSAWFENGSVTRSVLIGEVALAHNASDPSKTSNTETIRLENFDKLDKVAPNPAFITQIDGKPGDYSLNLSHISRTQVAFKYQINVPTSSPGQYAPLSLQPSWKIEPNQSSVILTYSLNPTFNLRGAYSVTLNNVTLVLHVGESGARATSCLSKPVGTFNKERNCIYWQLGDITLTAGGQQKLLARFITEGEAVQGRVEARWEASGVDGSGLSVSSRGDGEDDPFQDEDASAPVGGGWKTVGQSKKVVSGTYQSS